MLNKGVKIAAICAILTAVILLCGCSTFSVKAPAGMYISTGDYVPEVKTLGILQTSKSVFALFFIYDMNAVRKDLYEQLIDKAKAVGADGVTNIQFYWKVSSFSYLTLFIASGIFDFYMEGVAIREK